MGKSQSLLKRTSTLVVLATLLTVGIVGVSMVAGAQDTSADTTSVETFELTDDSFDGLWYSGVDLTVDWELSGDYEDVTVTVVHTETGQTLAEYSGMSGSENYIDYARYGDEFQITLEATAADGSTVCKRYTGPADGQPNFLYEDCSDDDASVNMVVTGSSISAESAQPGDNVTASFEITNKGDAGGVQRYYITVNGEEADNYHRSVALEAGESTTIETTRQFDETGNYTIGTTLDKADSVEYPTVSVEEDDYPNIKVTSFSLSESEITTGEEVTLTAEMKNFGNETEIAFTRPVVNGNATTLIDDQTELQPGETATIEYDFSWNETGDYTLGINQPLADGVSKPTVTVNNGPEFEVTATSVSQTTAAPGEEITLDFEITNVGDMEGAVFFRKTIDGNVVQLYDNSESLEAGESFSTSYTYTFNESELGDHTIGVSLPTAEGVEYPTVTIEEDDYPNIKVTSFSVSDYDPAPGEEVTLTAEMKNFGNETEIAFTRPVVNGNATTLIDDQTELQPGETATIEYDFSWNETGDYTLGINQPLADGVYKPTVTVSEPSGPDIEVLNVTDRSYNGVWYDAAVLDLTWEITNVDQEVVVQVVRYEDNESIVVEEYTGSSGEVTFTQYNAYGTEYDIVVNVVSACDGTVLRGTANGENDFQTVYCLPEPIYPSDDATA